MAVGGPGSVEVRGGLWGSDLLALIASGDGGLPKGTLDAPSYGLPRRAETEQAARASWTLLTAAWDDFASAHEEQVAAAGTEAYGSDDFTWSRWTRHLLAQLGYRPEQTAPGGIVVGEEDEQVEAFPITHLHEGQVVVHVLPAGTPLDVRTAGVHGAARRSPHSMVQEYLNRTDDRLWAVVTNGLRLRVLRDNVALTRQAFLEFDVAAMLREGAYADFSLMWHAVHATRFTHAADTPAADCIAEVWQQHAVQAGVAALDDLRDGVERAIEALGTGLLAHPANQALRDALADPDHPLDGDALYRELLFVAYRHVFWFAIDDRGLLHPEGADPDRVRAYRDHYSSQHLRNRARRHLGGRHPDGWAQFLATTAWFGDPEGCPSLAIPPLLGALWDAGSTPHLSGTVLTNRDYFEAVRRLSHLTRDGVLQRVNYETMGSEELGSIYESLLEVTPRVDVTERSFVLSSGAGNARRTTGSYYTPSSLIARTLDDALDPVVEGRLAAAVEGLRGAEERRRAQEAALLDLTVCDPAMGSAHFLVAAGMRLARHLATVRTGEPEPSPAAVQHAFRDVASRCLYGVDVNPMAVELAKVAIWLEAHVPGQPLTFLDHHLRCGNAVVGIGFDATLVEWAAPRLGESEPRGGVPDAAFEAHEGDDKPAAKRLRTANRRRRNGIQRLQDGLFREEYAAEEISRTAVALRQMEDGDAAALAAKRAAYADLEADVRLLRERLKADAWTACWMMRKDAASAEADDQPHDVFYDCFDPDLPGDARPAVARIRSLARRWRFFHWYLEFPEVARDGGFACLLANPPWERIKLQEKEWFANAGREDIAAAPNAAARGRLIRALDEGDDADVRLAARWRRAQRRAAAQSEFSRSSGRFPHGGIGDVNLYALFADHLLGAMRDDGSAGFVCPTGLLVGDTYKRFLQHLIAERLLACAWTFENEEKLFPSVHNETKFAIVVLRGGEAARPIHLTGYVRRTTDIDDPDRRYTLTPADVLAINPNTRTLPLFRQAASARVTAGLHRAAPILVTVDDEDREVANPWGVTYLTLFHMANDAHRFVTATAVVERGAQRDGGDWMLPDGGRLRPLYEGKMIWHYDHRYGTYDGQTQAQANKQVLPHTSDAQKADPDFRAEPRYWVDGTEIRAAYDAKSWDRDWVLTFRDVGPKERTFVVSPAPAYAFGNPSPVLLIGAVKESPLLMASLSSLVVDFAARQKTSGRMLLYVLRQLPVLPPEIARTSVGWGQESVLDFVRPRVVELAHTGVELDGFGADMGLPGRPFRWDSGRREVLRAELDALICHLYGLDRPDVEWILDSFEVLRKYEEASADRGGFSEFRTRRLVLERYDAMVDARRTGSYTTPLDPPPADDRLRHP